MKQHEQGKVENGTPDGMVEHRNASTAVGPFTQIYRG